MNASLITFSTNTTFTLNSPLGSLLPFELLLLLNFSLSLTVQPLILCAQLFPPVLTLCSTSTSTKYTPLANPTLPTAGRERGEKKRKRKNIRKFNINLPIHEHAMMVLGQAGLHPVVGIEF